MGIFKHPPSDYPSPLLWFLDETHNTVTAGTAIAILWSQSAQSVWFAGGAVGSTLVARAIKHLIRQPRPPPDPTESRPSRVRPKRTYGMPSTHSTALAFYLAYLWPLLPLVTSGSAGCWLERTALVTLIGLGLWSRVELGYHTVPQVVAGAGVGVVSAIGWTKLWSTYPDIRPAIQGVIDYCRSLF